MDTLSGTPATDVLPVSEIFTSLQGEGPSTGRLATFVRLGGCNLTCRGCDTPYTWDSTRHDLRAELTARTAGQIAAAALAGRAPLSVLTGGEPLLYQRRAALADLIDRLVAHGRVEVETNGTIAPAAALTCRQNLTFNVSPKLAGPISDDPAPRRLVPAALHAFAQLARTGRAWFKFVCSQPADVDTAADLATTYGVPAARVWIMPAGTTTDTVLTGARALAEPAMYHDFNLTLRQHVLLWHDQRGR